MITSHPNSLGNDSVAAVERILRPGERLLWTGRPDPSRHFAKADLVVIPFTVVWAAGVVGFLYQALKHPQKEGGFAIAMLTFFVAIGFYMVLGRFILKASRKRKTTYAITTQRALELRGGSVTDTALPSGSVSTSTNAKGTHGQVTFSSANLQQVMAQNTGLDLFTTTGVGFFDVPRPQAMFDALAQAQNGTAENRNH